MIIALWIALIALAGVVARCVYVSTENGEFRDQEIGELQNRIAGPLMRKVSESHGRTITVWKREGGLSSEVAELHAQAIEMDRALSSLRAQLNGIRATASCASTLTDTAHKRIDEFNNELRTDTVDVDLSKYDVTIGKKVRALYEFLGLEEDLSPGTPGTRSTPPKVVAVRKAGPKKGKT